MTALYGRRDDEVAVDEVERILICVTAKCQSVMSDHSPAVP